ncbi:origin recognition complex subunit 4 C-terminus-domain-containing protein, partial [Elsinoe ampelina]
LVGLDAEYQKVAGMIEQTVTAGESNSMVLIGARGSGKSALVDNVIREQQVSHANDFHVVRLSGFVHTDDKVAIREIWRQLGREMEIDDDSLVKNYADTLTTLLALLSHPSETGQETQGRMAKSVIIILDEFDLFTHHPRQTLLYNLFDIAQSRKAPIAVLGLTTRFDVAEALEKRVKSRFSHRQTYLPLARTFAIFKSMCQSHLTLPTPTFNTWNTLITTLFTTNNPLNTLLLQTYHTTKSVPSFLTALYLPFASLPTSPTTLAALTSHLDSHLAHAPSLSPPDSLLSLLPSLSTLQLSLLIAAARLVIIHDSDAISFPLAYDEYKSLASKARIAASASGALATGQGARVWGVRVARMAWEGLVERGLVVEDGVGGGRGAGRVDVSLEEIGGVLEGGGVEGVGQGMVRWCREI